MLEIFLFLKQYFELTHASSAFQLYFIIGQFFIWLFSFIRPFVNSLFMSSTLELKKDPCILVLKRMEPMKSSVFRRESHAVLFTAHLPFLRQSKLKRLNPLHLPKSQTTLYLLSMYLPTHSFSAMLQNWFAFQYLYKFIMY